MGKTCRYHREHGNRDRSDARSDSMNLGNDASYDDVMDMYADPLDANSEHYDRNEEDEDDI